MENGNGKILNFNGVTRLGIAPDKVLQSAIGKLDEVVVIGYEKDGEEYFASSESAGPEILWLLERARKKLLDIVEEE